MKLVAIACFFLIFNSNESTDQVANLDDLYPLSIIHLNDFHAKYEETNRDANECKAGEECIGGYARVVTAVKMLLEQQKDLNPVYLNAGDNFQGTLWYNMFRWNVTSYFLNMLPADVMTIGNHEFDNGVEGVVPFLETVDSPIVICNVDDSLEPTFQGKYQNSIVIERSGRKIGVIGVILSSTDQIASAGKLKFTDESEAVKREAELLTEQGINIIIVLSHCGLDVDKIIGRDGGSNIDIIVGGHSHTFMFTGDNPPGPDTPRDNYPYIVEQKNGYNVLIVQASAYAKYLGNITLFFDEDGIVQYYEGSPLYLDASVTPDPVIASELLPWKIAVDDFALRDLGGSRTVLSNQGCNRGDCALGNLITDSFVDSMVPFAEDGEWTYAAISFTNNGGIRTNLNVGSLNYGNLVSVIPFENTLDTFELRGDYLLEALESNAAYGDNGIQVSGIRVVYDVSRPIGQRVVKADLLCNACRVPKYEPLDVTKYYRMVVPSFLANGNVDAWAMVRDNAVNYHVGRVDIEAFANYVEKMSPLMAVRDGRITFV